MGVAVPLSPPVLSVYCQLRQSDCYNTMIRKLIHMLLCFEFITAFVYITLRLTMWKGDMGRWEDDVAVYLESTGFDKVSRGSAVCIATAYGLDDRGVGVRVLVESEFSLLHIVQTGSGAPPTSYSMGTGCSLHGGKAAGAWRWPITST
jgi:hypothetical protein